jgi:zinc transport system substrate-binding protein
LKLLLGFLGLCCAAAVGCSPRSTEEVPAFVATIHPLRAILAEVAGEASPVSTLLPAGVSPHTYEPRPSDARKVEAALGFFYIAPDVDGWAARMPARARRATAEWIPEALALHWEELEAGDDHGHHDHDDGHGHGEVNTHYWGDPLLVQAMLPAFTEALAQLQPEREAELGENAARFAKALQALHEELEILLRPVRGKRVVLFHPSWNYFLRRYGIVVAGIVEPYGGKEMSPLYLKRLTDRLKTQDIAAVFTEPQLNRRPAEVVAESGPWPLAELDPIGGVPGRTTYRELLLHNAQVLLETLQ